MAIVFKQLAKDKPTTDAAEPIVPGRYLALIKKAEMREGNNGEYLNLLLELQNENKKQIGTVYDILKESQHQLQQYKLRRILIATGVFDIIKDATLELKDLPKLIQNKYIEVDVRIEPEKTGFPAKPVVDAYKDEIYYPVSSNSNANPFQDNEINAADADEDEPF